MKMTLRQLHGYLGEMPAIRAQEALEAATTSSIPFMDGDDAGDILQSWRADAGIENPALETISFDDFRKDIKNRIA